MGARTTARPICLTAIIYMKSGGKERRTLKNLYMADQVPYRQYTKKVIESKNCTTPLFHTLVVFLKKGA